jgi:hypothetical protein
VNDPVRDRIPEGPFWLRPLDPNLKPALLLLPARGGGLAGAGAGAGAGMGGLGVLGGGTVKLGRLNITRVRSSSGSNPFGLEADYYRKKVSRSQMAITVTRVDESGAGAGAGEEAAGEVAGGVLEGVAAGELDGAGGGGKVGGAGEGSGIGGSGGSGGELASLGGDGYRYKVEMRVMGANPSRMIRRGEPSAMSGGGQILKKHTQLRPLMVGDQIEFDFKRPGTFGYVLEKSHGFSLHPDGTPSEHMMHFVVNSHGSQTIISSIGGVTRRRPPSAWIGMLFY